MKISLKPFLKWAGGKKWIKKNVDEIIKKEFNLTEINNYHEPFLGGGAVFFHLKYNNAFISDLNSELINTYLVVKNNLNELFDELKIHQKKHNENYYYEVRSWDRKDDFLQICKIKRAARFLYLNKACFNGLYRVNSQGYFNVPIGFSKNKNIDFDFANLINISFFLNEINVQMNICSFEDVVKNVRKNDLVYFDPPYYKEINSNSFTKYTKNDFTKQDHEKLKIICDKIVSKGAYVIISNSNTDFIKKLFIENSKIKIKYKYKCRELSSPRTINSKINNRMKVGELLIFGSPNFNKK